MDADAIRALVQETLIAAQSTASATATAAAAAAIRDAMDTRTRDITSLTRKPDLPPFDKANIDVWIRRVENAFTRAAIISVKDKFAFLESKIGADADPKITEYFCTSPLTNDTWDEFVAYLKKRYGRTKRQQVQSLISGTEFDGLQPSAVVSLMKEKAGSITIDDIIKEHVYRRLPVDLQRQLAQEADTMTAGEFSELADSFYDRDGRPLHASTSTSVNAIGGGVSASINPNASSSSSSSTASFTAAFSQGETNDINAVRARQGQKQRYNNNNNNNNNNNRPSSNNNNNNSGRNNNNNDRYSKPNVPKIQPNGLCRSHDKFGDDAYTCASGCRRWSSFQAGKGRPSKQ